MTDTSGFNAFDESTRLALSKLDGTFRPEPRAPGPMPNPNVEAAAREIAELRRIKGWKHCARGEAQKILDRWEVTCSAVNNWTRRHAKAANAPAL